MKEELKKQIKEMGEKISRGVSAYKAEVVRLNYETFQPETYTATVKSFSADLSKEEVAKRLSVDPRGVRDLSVTNGTVFVCLENALSFGVFVVGEMNELQKTAIKAMGEKISRTATVYKAEVVRLNYETFQPETFTATVKSFRSDLSKEEVAKRLSVDPRGVRDLKAITGTVYISLEDAFKRGVYVKSKSVEELLEENAE